MASGRQIAKENKERFDAWVMERYQARDWSAYVRGGKINRTEIARECGFARSVMEQNPAIKQALADVERDLADQGVLNPSVPTVAVAPSAEARTERERQRLQQLEQQNQMLRAENDRLKDLLERYQLMDEYLQDTGRLPR